MVSYSAQEVRASVKEMQAFGKMWHRAGDRHGTLAVSRVGDRLWWTNSFIAAEVDVAAGLLFAKFDQTVEPGVFDVNGTITRREGSDTPNLEALIPQGTLPQLHRRTWRGYPIVVRLGDVDAAVFECESTGFDVAVNERYVQFVDHEFPEVAWFGEGPTKPLVGRVDGRVVALIMPVRCA